MKKSIVLLFLVIIAIAFASCKKCVTCTESGTQTKSNYCGTPIDVKAFEDDLKSMGASVGQNWTCVND